MRRLLLAIPASLLLVSTYAGAQSKDYPLTYDTSVSTVEVRADRPLRSTLTDYDPVKGIYALSNGWTLRVESTRAGILAKIDDERSMHLIALSGNRFRTRDGNVEMQFGLGYTGDDMTMSYVPRSSVASVITVGTGNFAAR